jgi:uncharacterized Fe-S cluster-containing protein
MNQTITTNLNVRLPGLDCGLCGYRLCSELEARLPDQPNLIKRCIHLSEDTLSLAQPTALPAAGIALPTCGTCAVAPELRRGQANTWRDSLGREFDFFLERFPEEPGPRETIIPHNPMLTRELDVQVGDVLIGRPLGMSCGCPVTHCGVAQSVDQRTGVITWCISGPLNPRLSGFKDLGYYIAEAYDGLIQETRCEIKLGMRYFFQPRMCMLQWRHSGLVNYVNKTPEGIQVRVEGLWIG